MHGRLKDVLILRRHTLKSGMRGTAVCGVLSDLQRDTPQANTWVVFWGRGRRIEETGQNVNIWGIWVGTLRKLFTLFCNLFVSLNGCQNEKVKNVRPSAMPKRR